MKYKQKDTYFGLTLPRFICKNFNIPFCYFIAKSLLCYPYITPQDSELFLSNMKIWKDIKNLYDNFYMKDSYSQIRIKFFSLFVHNKIKSFVETQTKTPHNQKLFIPIDTKLFEWVIKFSFPTHQELTDLAYELNWKSGESMAGWLFDMLAIVDNNEVVTAEKIAEYIYIYKDYLSIEHFDHLMQLYSSKVGNQY